MNPLITERLCLSLLNVGDAPFILKLLNEPGWIKWIGDRKVISISDAENYILNGPMASYQIHGFGLMKVSLRTTNEAIGLCGLLKRDFLDHPDVGFALLGGYEGNGYALEAANTIIAHLGLFTASRTLYAFTHPLNIRSQLLLRKIGMKQIKLDNLPEMYQDSTCFKLDVPPLTTCEH